MQSDKLNLIRTGGVEEPGEPEGRRGFSMGRVEDKLFIWNGYSIINRHGNRPKTYRDSEEHIMHMYDINNKCWSSIETQGDRIISCTGSGVCSVDSKIYVFGGFSQYSFYNTFASFDTGKYEWREIKGEGQTPQPRDKLSMFLHDNQMYVFGGWSFCISPLQPGAAFHQDSTGWGAGWNNEFYKYDIATNHWSYVQTSGRVPEPRAATSFVKIDSERALLFGGRTQASRTNDLYIFHISTGTWEFFITPSMTPEMPWPCERSLFSVHLVSDPRATNPQVLGFWGMDKVGKVLNDYWVYDSLTSKWHMVGESFRNLAKPRLWGGSCSFFNNRTGTTHIFVFGGCTGSLLGPDSMNSEDLPGIIQFEFGIKRLEMLCLETIVANFSSFSDAIKRLPPNILDRLHALLK